MMTKKEDLLQCIRDLQTPQGSLRSSVESQGISCLYATTLALGALCEVNGADAICDDLVLYLLQVMDGSWTLPHHEGEDGGVRSDITCCALEAMTRFRRSVLTPEAMVKVVQALTGAEVAEGGPYRSFFDSAEDAGDRDQVDPVTNTFVAAFLVQHDIRSDALNAYLQTSVADMLPSSSVQALPAKAYVYSRLKLPMPFMRRWIGNLVAEQDPSGSWGNPLQTACALVALLRVQGESVAVRKGIRYLEALSIEEMCRPYAFEVVEVGGRSCASGALTAACCVEALDLHEGLRKKSLQQISQKGDEGENRKEQELYLLIRTLINKRVQSLRSDVRTGVEMHASSLLDRDHTGEIAMLPYRFYESMHPSNRRLSDREIAELCLANVYGWMAYSIYDDVLDEEGGAQALSVANICLRSVSEIFQRIGGHAYRQFVHVMDRVDTANAWELRTCRTSVSQEKILVPRALPDDDGDWTLVERSLGHALGPVTILFQLGYTPSSKEVRSLRAFFWHYICAKQLCDDVEDWELDMRNGQLNYVGRSILRALRITKPSFEIDERIHRLFWTEILPNIVGHIECHIGNTRIALERLDHIIADKGAMEALLQRYADTAAGLRVQQQERVALLKAYDERDHPITSSSV